MIKRSAPEHPSQCICWVVTRFACGRDLSFSLYFTTREKYPPINREKSRKKKFQPHAKRVTTQQVHRLGCPGALLLITKAQNRLPNFMFYVKIMLLEAPAPVYGTGVPQTVFSAKRRIRGGSPTGNIWGETDTCLSACRHAGNTLVKINIELKSLIACKVTFWG